MDRIELMSMYVRIVETGSLSAVAKELKTTQPTVSKRLEHLERHLKVRLLARNTHGVCTTEAGIDIAHTGLCIKDEQGVVHFMDASSARRSMKVTLEPEISKCLNWSPRLTGVMIARPLEVRTDLPLPAPHQ